MHIYTYTPSHSSQSQFANPSQLQSTEFLELSDRETVSEHVSDHVFGASMNALVLGKTYGRLVVLEDRCLWMPSFNRSPISC